MKLRALLALTTGTIVAITLNVAPAQAGGSTTHPSPQVSNISTLAEGLVGPLKVAFGPHGNVLVAESFAGMLTSLGPDGSRNVLYAAPGKEVGGVSYGNGTTYFFDNVMGTDEEPQAAGPALVKAMNAHGTVRTLTDLTVYETAHDPDGATIYGVRDASAACLAQAPGLQQHGEVYSHPYSSTPSSHGVYVGDAGGNAIYHVSNHGKVSLLKTLPAEPIVITEQVAALAAEMGLEVPQCMMGLTYWAQPVPTDITVRGQWLYYTVLPGVPGESLSVGKVYRMHLVSGTTQLLASGLNAPTGVAVDKHGSVFVTELFGNGVGKIVKGHSVTVLPAGLASDVAISGNRLAASVNALAPSGAVVTATLR